MTSYQAAFRDAPFQLRGGAFTILTLKVTEPNAQNFFFALSDKVRQSPDFFRNAAVVLDLDDLSPGEPFDFAHFVGLLRTLGLVAVGLTGGSQEQQDEAVAAGLALLPAPRPEREKAAESATAPVQAAPQPVAPVVTQTVAVPTPVPALVITEAVRSGRQIYAQGGDLVVVGTVSPGAELAADGNIHVYGTLRGRALAGVAGDQSARIFCHSLEAEMVSIAGLYRLSEDFEKDVVRRPVQVHLDQGFLRIAPLAV